MEVIIAYRKVNCMKKNDFQSDDSPMSKALSKMPDKLVLYTKEL